MRVFLFLLMIIFAVFLVSCASTSDETCNSSCKEYEICNEETCELISGKCKFDTDCTMDTTNLFAILRHMNV